LDSRFLEVKAQLEEKAAAALTPGLKDRYTAALAEVTTAYETLVLAAEADSVGISPPAREGSPMATAPVGKPPRASFGRRLGWHIIGMLKGGLVAAVGLAAGVAYLVAFDHTPLDAPGPDFDGGLTLIAGFIGMVVLPGLFAWQASVLRAQKLPLPTRRYFLAISIFAVAAMGGVMAFHNRTVPPPAVVSAQPVGTVSATPPPAAQFTSPKPVPSANASATRLIAEGLDLREGKNGVAPDPVAAVERFRQAADLGSRDGMYWLGASYESGRGVPQDSTLALKWYQAAADLGDEYALKAVAGIKERIVADQRIAAFEISNQATALWEGKGVARDSAKAVELWRQAAEKGVPQAMWGLGLAYESGDGVARDVAAAEQWFQRAAAGGVKGAAEALAELKQAAVAREAAAVQVKAALQAAEARFSGRMNTGRLVSLRPGFAGWHGRKLKAPKGYEMLEASNVYIGMPWGRKQVGSSFVDDPPNVWVGTYRMVPGADLKQADRDSSANSTTSLFSHFEDSPSGGAGEGRHDAIQRPVRRDRPGLGGVCVGGGVARRQGRREQDRLGRGGGQCLARRGHSRGLQARQGRVRAKGRQAHANRQCPGRCFRQDRFRAHAS
jgi:TPR repeat protein